MESRFAHRKKLLAMDYFSNESGTCSPSLAPVANGRDSALSPSAMRVEEKDSSATAPVWSAPTQSLDLCGPASDATVDAVDQRLNRCAALLINIGTGLDASSAYAFDELSSSILDAGQPPVTEQAAKKKLSFADYKLNRNRTAAPKAEDATVAAPETGLDVATVSVDVAPEAVPETTVVEPSAAGSSAPTCNFVEGANRLD